MILMGKMRDVAGLIKENLAHLGDGLTLVGCLNRKPERILMK